VFGIMGALTPQPKLTAAEKEARRKLAVRKVLSGRTQADVADFLGVHAVTVAKWMKAYCDGGEDAVVVKPVPGRPRFLTAEQEAEVRGWLLRKPTEFGFRTDLWTAARVAQLIRDRLGGVPPERPAGVAGQAGVLAAEAHPPAEAAEPAGDRRLARAGVPGDQKKSPPRKPTSS
jgi:transposase